MDADPPPVPRPAGSYGRYLEVDLETGRSQAHPMSAGDAGRVIGGAGVAVLLLLRHGRPGISPLAPECPIVFAACPLVDTGITTTARACIAARSPQTGLLGESLISSRIAVELKRIGYDALVLRGGCPELSCLVVDNDDVRLIRVPDLRGADTQQAEAGLRARLPPGFSAAVIGPAGESGVRFAGISHDRRHAGRTGLGAVLGARRLKGIALRGSRSAAVADPEALRNMAARFRERSLGAETAKYRLAGTAANVLTMDRLGVLPARNFRDHIFKGSEALSAERLQPERLAERSGCFSCTIGCEHRYLAPSAPDGVRAEYETLFALGPNLGIDDADEVLDAARTCDLMGMDTLSFGGAVAWALECAERGLLPDPRGRRGWLADLARRCARRADELGDLLADGSLGAARRLGGGSEAWAMQVKGLELPGYEPRALPTLALGLAVSARGACHNRSGGYEVDLAAGPGRRRSDREHAQAAVESEDRAAVMDSLPVCRFLRHCFEDFYRESAALLAAVTGDAWDAARLRRAGEGIVALKRLFNQLEGAGRGEDTLPERLLSRPIAEGPAAGAALDAASLEGLLDAYYAERGWSPDGRLPSSVVDSLLAGLVRPAFR